MRTSGYLRAMIVVAACGVAWVATSHATTLVIQPSSQDAYVNQSQPNHVFGSGSTNTRIFVMSSNPNPRVERGLVQFDLPIPQFSTINSAILEINEQSGNLPNTRVHGVHRVTVPWLQSTVKWNTQPPAGMTPTATAIVGTSRGFKAFDVTADVQAFVNNPATNFGWMVRDQSENVGNDVVSYVTREEDHIPDIPKKPMLTVDYTAPACSNDSECQDSDLCTTNERCDAGHCAVDPVNCDDNNACTDDICDPQQGCLHPIGECNDGFTCTVDSCDPVLGCVNTPVPSVCLHGGCQTGTCVADQNDPTLDPITGCLVQSVQPDGSSCSDGSACTQSDTCEGGECIPGAPVTCPPPDQCHDAGTCDPGTGVCSNPAKPDGTPCDDGNPCTNADHCTAGTCGGTAASCGDFIVQPACGEDCDVGPGGGGDCTANCKFICGPAPQNGCLAPTLSQKTRLQIKNKTPDTKDLLVWKWLKGQATTLPQLGSPTTTTGYTLCMWDQSANPQPIFRAQIAPGGTCATKPCWKAINNGDKFKDKAASQHGMQNIVVKAGAAGKAKITLKGKGTPLQPPALPLTPTVTVQLKNDSGTCWTAPFSTPQLNLPDQFKAKGD